jgi:broad specificity phosphatase PhoE
MGSLSGVGPIRLYPRPARGCCAGAAGRPLSAAGRREVEAVAGLRADTGGCASFTAAKPRAQQTAEQL